MSFITRREFVKASVGALALTNCAISAAMEADDLRKKYLRYEARELKIDPTAAEERYKQLLQKVPLEFRSIPQLPAGAKNRKDEFITCMNDYQHYLTYYTPQGKKLTEDDEHALYEEVYPDIEPVIPWPDDQIFAKVKRWLQAQQPVYERVLKLLNDTDYLSYADGAELKFYDLNNDPWLEIFQPLRHCCHLLNDLSQLYMRERKWSELAQVFEQQTALFRCLQRGKQMLMHYLGISGCIRVLGYRYVQALQQPQLPTEYATKFFASLQKLEELFPDYRAVMIVERFEYSLIELATIPDCKSPGNQILATKFLGLVGIAEQPLVEPECKTEPDTNDPFEAIWKESRKNQQIHQNGLYLITEFLLAKHPQPFDREVTFQVWLKEQLAWFKHYDQHRQQLPFPTFRSTITIDNFSEMLKSTGYLSLAENQAEALKKLDLILSSNQEAQQAMQSEANTITNPLGQYWLEPIQVQAIIEADQFNASGYNPQLHAIHGIVHNQIRLLVLAAACWQYERQHQRLPEKLSQLVDAKLLDKLPIDQATGQAFGYDAKRRFLWCSQALDKKTGKLPTDIIVDEEYTPPGIQQLLRITEADTK